MSRLRLSGLPLETRHLIPLCLVILRRLRELVFASRIGVWDSTLPATRLGGRLPVGVSVQRND